MIRGAKVMIAGCIDQMLEGACGDCGRRDSCILHQWRGLGRRAGAMIAERPKPTNRARGLLSRLGDLAKAIETQAGIGIGPFTRRVEASVEPLLEAGGVRIEAVARELGCSRQTLYRRLKAENTTFEQVVERLRRRLALRLLREKDASVKEVAYRLGFSDPAAFSRAFKRWTGSSPSRACSRQER
jgi:AraC-like DNA-binding protein